MLGSEWCAARMSARVVPVVADVPGRAMLHHLVFACCNVCWGPKAILIENSHMQIQVIGGSY